MYHEAIQALGDQASAKLAAQRRSLPGHLIRSMLAGMYVGLTASRATSRPSTERGERLSADGY